MAVKTNIPMTMGQGEEPQEEEGEIESQTDWCLAGSHFSQKDVVQVEEGMGRSWKGRARIKVGRERGHGDVNEPENDAL